VDGEDLLAWSGAAENRSTTQEVFVSHANAALTPRARLKVARLVIVEGWPIARVAERYDV